MATADLLPVCPRSICDRDWSLDMGVIGVSAGKGFSPSSPFMHPPNSIRCIHDLKRQLMQGTKADPGRSGENKLITEGDPVGPAGSQRKSESSALFLSSRLVPSDVCLSRLHRLPHLPSWALRLLIGLGLAGRVCVARVWRAL